MVGNTNEIANTEAAIRAIETLMERCKSLDLHRAEIVRELGYIAAAGQKIRSVKLLRAIYGIGLMQAKQEIEAAAEIARKQYHFELPIHQHPEINQMFEKLVTEENYNTVLPIFAAAKIIPVEMADRILRNLLDQKTKPFGE